MAHTRKLGPYHGLDFQVKSLTSFQSVACRSGSEIENCTDRYSSQFEKSPGDPTWRTSDQSDSAVDCLDVSLFVYYQNYCLAKKE